MNAVPKTPAPKLGRAARALWTLRENASFLNHGSYGACPLPVLSAQAALRQQLEAHPDAFMARIHPDGGHAAVRDVARALAWYVGASEPDLAMVENATHGVHAVLQSVPLARGDEVLSTDHQYGAVRLAIEVRCRDTGAAPRVVPLPLPIEADGIVERVLGAIGPRTRLVVLDHITSPTALRLPLERIVPELVRREIPVLVDGAHTLGQIDLDLAALDADWHVSNVHKWLYGPRGSAVLFASPRAAARTRPLIASHFVGLGFPRAFDYIGTRDYTAWLAAPAALEFRRSLEGAGIRAHVRSLVDAGSRALENAGARPVAPRDEAMWMRAFELPQARAATQADADEVMRGLWERERIQIRCAIVANRLLLRFCAQAYVEADELHALGRALARHGWPARS